MLYIHMFDWPLLDDEKYNARMTDIMTAPITPSIYKLQHKLLALQGDFSACKSMEMSKIFNYGIIMKFDISLGLQNNIIFSIHAAMQF